MKEEKEYAVERAVEVGNLLIEAGFSRQVWEHVFAAIDVAYEEMEEDDE